MNEYESRHATSHFIGHSIEVSGVYHGYEGNIQEACVAEYFSHMNFFIKGTNEKKWKPLEAPKVVSLILLALPSVVQDDILQM